MQILIIFLLLSCSVQMAYAALSTESVNMGNCIPSGTTLLGGRDYLESLDGSHIAYILNPGETDALVEIYQPNNNNLVTMSLRIAPGVMSIGVSAEGALFANDANANEVFNSALLAFSSPYPNDFLVLQNDGQFVLTNTDNYEQHFTCVVLGCTVSPTGETVQELAVCSPKGGQSESAPSAIPTASGSIPTSEYESLISIAASAQRSDLNEPVTWPTTDATYHLDAPCACELSPVVECWDGIRCICSEVYTAGDGGDDFYATHSNSSFSNYTCTVVSLDLEGHGYRGQFAWHALENLPNLTAVDVGGNYWTGTLPDRLELFKLESFRLYYSSISGSFPHDWAETLRHTLKTFVLSVNGLTFGPFPESVLSMPLLETVNLGSISLTGTVPADLGQYWPNLQTFQIFENRLTGNLDTMLSSATLGNLTYLDVGGNFFTGSIPSSWFSDTKKLTVFAVEENSLTGTLPASAIFSDKMLFVDLDKNFFSGPIDETFLFDVTAIGINAVQNLFSGTIPSEARLGSFAKWISFNDNFITGSVPFWCMRDVFVVTLRNNLLYGTIPTPPDEETEEGSSSTSTSVITGLDVSFNMISGTIPSNLASAYRFLGTLDLAHNRVTGTFPTEGITGLPLRYVDVSSNRLSGNLPHELMANGHINSFIAQLNCFQGTLSEKLCEANKLEWLVLNGVSSAESCTLSMLPIDGISDSYRFEKHLTGSIPDCLLEMPMLRDLQLSGNSLTGTLSPSLTLTPYMTNLQLSHNQLRGEIPEALQRSSGLTTLDLAHNKFGGTLVDDFRDSVVWTDNHVISLDSCRLSGPIPSSVFNYDHSVELLRGNSFSCHRTGVPAADEYGELYECGDAFLHTSYLLAIPFSVALVAVCLLYEMRRKRAISSGMYYNSNVNDSAVSDADSGGGFTAEQQKEADSTGTEVVASQKDCGIGDGNVCVFDDVEADSQQQAVDIIPQHSRGSGGNDISIQPSTHADVVDTDAAEAEATGGLVYVGRVMNKSYDRYNAVHAVAQMVRNTDSATRFGADTEVMSISIREGLLSTAAAAAATVSIEPHFSSNSLRSFSSIVSPFERSRSNWSLGRHEQESIRSMNIEAILVNHHIDRAVATIDFMLRYSQRIAFFSIVVLLPLYVWFAQAYSTHTHRYSWLPSAAYLSGTTPAIVLVCVLALFLLCGHYASTVLLKMEAFEDQNLLGSIKSNLTHMSSFTFWHGLIMTVVVIIDLVIVLFAHGSTVYIQLHYSRSVVVATRMALAGFKLHWTKIIFDFVLPRMKTIYVRFSSYVDDAHHTTTIRDTVLFLLLNMVNNIAAPVLASAAVEPNCFYDVLISPAPQKLFYKRQVSIADEQSLFAYESVTYETSFISPFSYSYQIFQHPIQNLVGMLVLHDSGAADTQNLPADIRGDTDQGKEDSSRLKRSIGFARTCCCNAFGSVFGFFRSKLETLAGKGELLWPVLQYACTASQWAAAVGGVGFNGDGSGGLGNIATVSPIIPINPTLTNKVSQCKPKPLLRRERLLADLTSALLVMCTFGILFPPLNLIVLLAIVSRVGMSKLAIGSALAAVADLNDKIKTTKEKSEEEPAAGRRRGRFKNVSRFYQQLKTESRLYMKQLGDECEYFLDICSYVVRWSILLMACFYALFVFDIFGDVMGAKGALWAPLVLFALSISLLFQDRVVSGAIRLGQYMYRNARRMFVLLLSNQQWTLRFCGSPTPKVYASCDDGVSDGLEGEVERG